MLTSFLFFALGLAALVAGAELLVRGASKLALSFGISPLVVGLTVVAFGTSSPEMAVSVQSAAAGKVDIAIGNVVGSNIFNILFILGLCAVVAPLVVARQIVRQEIPVMLGASVLLMLFAVDGRLGKLECGLLALLLVGYTVFLIVQSRAATADQGADFQEELARAQGSRWDSSRIVQGLLVVAGFALLVVGANWLVDAAIEFAKRLGVSDTVIGLTIVAAGTSMPEVAASVLATIRGHRDIAVGNVIGSNTFNILGVLGFSGLAASGDLIVADSIVRFDLPVMLAVSAAALPILFTGHVIARWEGWVFLAYYVAYTAFLILAASDHAALGLYSKVMMSFVMPIAVLTIVVVVVRELGRERPG